MQTPIHTVLGPKGSVGRAVIAALQKRDFMIRAVSRGANLEGLDNRHADLLDAQQAEMAIAGSNYVYLCVGLPYSKKVWARDWPQLMSNVLEACAKAKAKLIFLDNIYMYGPSPLVNPITEEHPQKPASQKGKVRKQVADMFLQAVADGRIEGLIGRAADFFGPYANNSVLWVSFLERMLQGKAPRVLFPLGIPHTYACVTDQGEALVQLALEESCYGQVWHLPVGPTVTMEEMTGIFNEVLGTSFKPAYIPGFMQAVLGLFIPAIREVKEMLYQAEHPYVISWEKFGVKFPDFVVSSYKDEAEKMVTAFSEKSP